MDKKEFSTKAISWSGGYGITATRNRNTDGIASITIAINAGVDENGETLPRQSMSFTTARYGDHYERVAFEVVDIMGRACDEPCLIPKPMGEL